MGQRDRSDLLSPFSRSTKRATVQNGTVKPAVARNFTSTPLEKLADDGMFRHFRPLYKGTLIANVKMDRDRGNRLIAEGLADLVAFGRPYIANPDLVQRFAENAPLAEVDWETVSLGAAWLFRLPNLPTIAR
jgi:2,4-dienoyl-CoA reductase-like NADH-dependent reductase (Old Yellow Enzyme family)